MVIKNNMEHCVDQWKECFPFHRGEFDVFMLQQFDSNKNGFMRFQRCCKCFDVVLMRERNSNYRSVKLADRGACYSS